MMAFSIHWSAGRAPSLGDRDPGAAFGGLRDRRGGGRFGELTHQLLFDAVDDCMAGFDLRVQQGALTDMKAVPLCRPDQDLGPGLVANAAVQLLGFDPFADNRWIANQVETGV